MGTQISPVERTESSTPFGNWITTAEAAELTGYAQVTIRQYIHRDIFDAIKRGKTWFVRKDQVLGHKDEMLKAGPAKFAPKS
jgi:excisionase family DNA binding protein